VNLVHRVMCKSDKWAGHLRRDIIPWALGDTDLGESVLELGPGPGRATELLLERASELTAIEIDSEAAERLRVRLTDPRLTVVTGDATSMPLPESAFSGVVSLTMLHHVPSVEAQDALFREAFRVLEPGGTFAGSDGMLTKQFRLVHLFDTLVAIDPATLSTRLEAAGFAAVEVDIKSSLFRFTATKPTGSARA
jgi:SAM-dependent methyltransferase